MEDDLIETFTAADDAGTSYQIEVWDEMIRHDHIPAKGIRTSEGDIVRRIDADTFILAKTGETLRRFA
jgi:hypothetical protein